MLHRRQVGPQTIWQLVGPRQRRFEIATHRGDRRAQLVRGIGHQLAALVEQGRDAVAFCTQVAQRALQVGGHVVEALRELAHFVRAGVDALREIARSERFGCPAQTLQTPHETPRQEVSDQAR